LKTLEHLPFELHCKKHMVVHSMLYAVKNRSGTILAIQTYLATIV